MRKKPFWKKAVYAGEYTVEFTRNQNGLHIHIHALLLVKKAEQNRNQLYEDILLAWNRQTTWEEAPRKVFSETQKAAIAKALKWENTNLVDDLLDPTGSTLCGLESLYVLKDGKKRYVNPENEKEFMAGIMECLKYHFEPCKVKKDKETGEINLKQGAMNQPNGRFDIDLIIEVLPAIYGQRLYAKIGAFYGDARLNMNQTDSLGKLMQEFKKQFVPFYHFSSMEDWELELKARGLDKHADCIKDFKDSHQIELPKNWQNLSKAAFSSIKKAFKKFLTDQYPEELPLRKSILRAFDRCFEITYTFQGIKALRNGFKEVFGSYYIRFAAAVSERLQTVDQETGEITGIKAGGIIMESDFKTSVDQVRKVLKDLLKEIEQEENLKDNAVNEGVFHPETLKEALQHDYCYRIRDIATVMVERQETTTEKDLYGQMICLGSSRYQGITFSGKLKVVMKQFAEFISREVREKAETNRVRRKIREYERVSRGRHPGGSSEEGATEPHPSESHK